MICIWSRMLGLVQEKGLPPVCAALSFTISMWDLPLRPNKPTHIPLDQH